MKRAAIGIGAVLVLLPAAPPLAPGLMMLGVLLCTALRGCS